eukprot:6466581-Pyramimonas_sp.AAC.1
MRVPKCTRPGHPSSAPFRTCPQSPAQRWKNAAFVKEVKVAELTCAGGGPAGPPPSAPCSAWS